MPIDWTALICYYKCAGTIYTNNVKALISAYAGHFPRPAAITQFFDYIAEDKQKWLLAFNYPKATTKFKEDTNWVQRASQEIKAR
jgi:hypothetical protein